MNYQIRSIVPGTICDITLPLGPGLQSVSNYLWHEEGLEWQAKVSLSNESMVEGLTP